MAQIREVKILDDLDGSEGAQTTVFALDGKEYEIDLSHENRARLGVLLGEFINAARRLGPGRRQSMARAGTAGNSGGSYPGGQRLSRDESATIRAWALANGMQVSDRGRISNDVLTAYNKRDKNKPFPAREVAYAEARSALVRAGENLVGRSKTYVAERYMELHPNTVVHVEQKIRDAG